MNLSAARRNIAPLAPGVLAIAGLAVLYYATARPALLVVDGETFEHRTHARRPFELLREAGIVVGAHDEVRPDGNSPLLWGNGALPIVEFKTARAVSLSDNGSVRVVETAETDPTNLVADQLFPGDRILADGLPTASAAPIVVEVKRAFPITLTIDGKEAQVHSAAPTLGEALWESGVRLHEGDRLDPPASTPLGGPMAVQLDSSTPLSIQVANREVRGRSAADHVEGALADAGLTLVGLDYSVPEQSAPIPPDGQIRLVRVREEVLMEQEPLRFETAYQPIDTLEIDNRQTVQTGAFGVLTNRVRVRTEDGEEISRTVEGDWVAQAPTTQIIGYGTQIQVRTVPTADGQLDYWRAVEMYATSYSPSRAGVSPDSPWFGITASGKPLKKGLVAIDRSLIPFGTMMYVPGYGYAEAADTGSGVRGRWIDLGYEDDNWVSWSGYVTVYFLTPVPSPDSIVYIFP